MKTAWHCDSWLQSPDAINFVFFSGPPCACCFIYLMRLDNNGYRIWNIRKILFQSNNNFWHKLILKRNNWHFICVITDFEVHWYSFFIAVGARLVHSDCQKLDLVQMHLHWKQQQWERAATIFWMAQRCGLAMLSMLVSSWLWLMLSQLL